jgi:hypothetical protein
MLLFNKERKMPRVFILGLATGLMASLVSVWFCDSVSARFGAYSSATIWPGTEQSENQDLYKSPEGAVNALVAALSANDEKKLLCIFGPEAKTIISSGDEVADRAGRERFLEAYQEKSLIVKVSDKRAVLETGSDARPFPIPIVREAGGDWRFDTRQGKEELLKRRVGNNELSAIRVCLAYVDAQREYASKDRNGDGVPEYAQKFLSEPGKKDGLYWEAIEGEEQSPWGPLIAEAQKEGYKKESGNEPSPYHGYFHQILKAQGRSVPRGVYNYVIDGRMTGGFAMVVYPVQYGSSGIKTFIVSHDGVIYEKDLGKKTASIAQAMTMFNPDKSWRKLESKDFELAGKKGGN